MAEHRVFPSLEVAAKAYSEALRVLDRAEEDCIEAARVYVAAVDAEVATMSPAHVALRAHAVAIIQRERSGYEQPLAGFLLANGLRPDLNALRSIDVRYLRAFSPAYIACVIQEVRKGRVCSWSKSIPEVNEVLKSRIMSLRHTWSGAAVGGDLEDFDVPKSGPHVRPSDSTQKRKQLEERGCLLYTSPSPRD